MPAVRVPPVPALLLSMLSIQGGAALAKSLFPELGPLGTSAMRVSLAALILAAVFRPDLRALGRSGWAAVIPYGLALGLMNLAFYNSLLHLPLGLAVTIEFVGPLALAMALSRRAADFFWVALAGLGIWLITPHGGGDSVSLVGIGLALLAGAFWAAYILAGGRVGRTVPGTTGVAAGMLVAALVTIPFGVAEAGAKLLNPNLLLLGVGVAVLSSALPYTLEMVALRAIPARVFGVMMSIEPAIAALSGWAFLHEHLSVMQWLAMGCVIAASAGINLSSSKGEGPQA